MSEPKTKIETVERVCQWGILASVFMMVVINVTDNVCKYGGNSPISLKDKVCRFAGMELKK